MSTPVRVIFEGDDRLRLGFSEFLRSVRNAAKQRGVSFRLIAGGGTPVRRFNIARRSDPNAVVLLLADSEGPVGEDPKQAPALQPHLQHLSGVRVEQVHVMVQLMEAWFLADREALRAYYGQGFRENRLPSAPNVEQVSKEDVLKGLADATEDTAKGRYVRARKGKNVKHGRDLLRTIDPAKVCVAAPHCDRLLDALHAAITDDNQQGSA